MWTLALSDGAPTLMPYDGQIVSGPYKPTNNSAGDFMPPPAPSLTNDPAPAGIATFASVYRRHGSERNMESLRL